MCLEAHFLLSTLLQPSQKMENKVKNIIRATKIGVKVISN